MTTTELAKFCGVSRFTILNWIEKGKINTIRTVGGRHRIPVAEAISFMETLQRKVTNKKKKVTTSGSLGHCWEYLQKTNCEKQCKNCLIYGRDMDYCFVVVRQFGKRVIRCMGDCLSCSYFEKFFGSQSKLAEIEDARGREPTEAIVRKEDFFNNFAYDIGRDGEKARGSATDTRESSSTIVVHQTSMKKTLSHLPEYKVNELTTVIEIILKEMDDVQMVILFGSYARGNWSEDVCNEKGYIYEYKSNFDIMVVTKYAETANNNGLQHNVEDKLNRTEATVNLIFHDINHVNSQLSKSSYFFTDIMEEGIMLYDTGRFTLSKRRKLNIRKRKQIAQQNFDEWVEKAERFYNHFQYDLEKNWCNEALFELHQSIKCLYTVALLVFSDYNPQNCDLEKIGKHVASYEPAFLAVFPRTTERQAQIFKLLNNAQVHTSSTNSYNITKIDLVHFEQCHQKLMELTQQICQEKINSFA